MATGPNGIPTKILQNSSPLLNKHLSVLGSNVSCLYIKKVSFEQNQINKIYTVYKYLNKDTW